MKSNNDISRKTWKRKKRLGELAEKIKYVAVSNWLADKAYDSSLLMHQSVTVIPNAFRLPDDLRPATMAYLDSTHTAGSESKDTVTILFGAARLDDPIKNLPALIEMTRVLKRDYPELSSRIELVTFGNVKNPAALEGIAIPHRHLGMLKGEEAVRRAYESADILVSSSIYETLPGTLVEAQAYGCVPVSFNQGGQSDIVEHLCTGYIAEFSEDIEEAGRRLARGVAWATEVLENARDRATILCRMRESVKEKFSPETVARSYLKLI